MKRSVLVIALPLCCGCSVLIQNRYSVLGIETGEGHSLAEARLWSVALLLGVAVVSASFAVLAFWLGQRWLRRRRARAKELLLGGSSPSPARAGEQDRTNGATEPASEAFRVE